MRKPVSWRPRAFKPDPGLTLRRSRAASAVTGSSGQQPTTDLYRLAGDSEFLPSAAMPARRRHGRSNSISGPSPCEPRGSPLFRSQDFRKKFSSPVRSRGYIFRKIWPKPTRKNGLPAMPAFRSRSTRGLSSCAPPDAAAGNLSGEANAQVPTGASCSAEPPGSSYSAEWRPRLTVSELENNLPP